jgi:hypothetical protein
MKTTIHSIITILAIGVLNLSTAFAAELSSNDRQFLAGYEQVRAALAADDLIAARKAATALSETGSAIAKSSSLEEARAAFAKLSEEAVKLAGGQPGYYVLHCGMVNKDWVQTSKQPSNPYAGKEMAGCGEVKK